MKCEALLPARLLWLSSILLASGCGLFNTEPFADTTYDQSGNLVVADTERMWVSFIERVGRRVNNELAGYKPEAGKASWDEFWLWWFEGIEEAQENAPKYIEYIVRTRRNHGLPDIEGYSTGEPANGPSIESIGESDEP